MKGDIKKIFKPHIAAWFGATPPICAFVFIGISIALSPWFSWTDNALSDLGVSPVAPIFNGGLILTGILLSLFAIAVTQIELKSRFGLASAISFLVAGFGVAGVGIFTEAFIELHILFAMFCFIPLLLSFILFGVRWALKRGISSSKILTILIVVGVVGIISGVIGVSKMNPWEFIDLYKNPPPEYITPEGTVDYLRIGTYMRELVKTRYNINIPGIALMEILFALPMLPVYMWLSIRFSRKKEHAENNHYTNKIHDNE